MLRAAAQQWLGRCGVASALAAPLEAAAGLRQAAPGLTLTLPRCYSSADAPGDKGDSEAASAGAPASPSSSGRASRQEWRSWIDTKLDSKLGALEQQTEEAGAPAAAQPAPSSPSAAEPKPRGPPPAARQARGFDLEQQIYSIVSAARPLEEAMLPEGVNSYSQLALASDAPRFLRAAANVADISPQRLHPTRLFFPQQYYAPQDLDPYKTSAAAAAGAFGVGQGPAASPDDVTRYGDFKNAPLLASFLSDAGKLPLRRRTELRAKLHRHLARQVKIARQMAILPTTERWQAPGPGDGSGRGKFGGRGQQRQQRPPRQQQQQQRGRA